MSTQYIVVSLILRSLFLNRQKTSRLNQQKTPANLLAPPPTFAGHASTLGLCESEDHSRPIVIIVYENHKM